MQPSQETSISPDRDGFESGVGYPEANEDPRSLHQATSKAVAFVPALAD